MIAMQEVMDQLVGTFVAGPLIEMMAENFEDFSIAQNRYRETMDWLQDQPGDAPGPSAKDDREALWYQISSVLFFSGILGLKANMDHFTDPIARSFLDVDPETYLREATVRRLPEYQHAQTVRGAFYASLSPEQKEAYETVTDYVSYLETIGPKLAHYYGYLLGNTLLSRIVPGYHPDIAMTVQYRGMLEKFFGKPLNWSLPFPMAILQGPNAMKQTYCH